MLDIKVKRMRRDRENKCGVYRWQGKILREKRRTCFIKREERVAKYGNIRRGFEVQ